MVHSLGDLVQIYATTWQGRPVPCRAQIWWIRAVPNIQDACGEATPPPLCVAVLFKDLMICNATLVFVYLYFCIVSIQLG